MQVSGEDTKMLVNGQNKTVKSPVHNPEKVCDDIYIKTSNLLLSISIGNVLKIDFFLFPIENMILFKIQLQWLTYEIHKAIPITQ